MQEENNLNKSFQEIFENIKNDVTKTQLEIMINANANLVNLYYRIGKTIFENSSNESFANARINCETGILWKMYLNH